MVFFQSILALTVFLRCLTGAGSQSLNLAVWFFVLTLTATFSKNFRQAVGHHWRASVDSFKRFARSQERVPYRAAFLVVALPTILLSLLNGRSLSSYDNYGANLMAAAMVTDGSIELSRFFDKCPSPPVYYLNCRDDGTIYSAYPAGTVAYALPFFALSRLLQTDMRDHKRLWRTAKFAASIIAGTITALCFLMALQTGSLWTATCVALFVGAGSSIFGNVSQGLWSHDGVTLSLTAALFIAFCLPWTKRHMALIGLFVSLMFASRLTSAILIAPLLLWVALRSFRSALVVATVALLAYLPWALLQQIHYHHPLGVQFALAKSHGSYFSAHNYLEALYGLLLSPGTGLFVYQPWALVLFLLPWTKFKNFWPASAPWLLLVLITAQLGLMGSWREWSGQICWGTRYLTEIIPALALLTAGILPQLESSKYARRFTYLVGVLAFFVQANGVFLKGREWYHHPLDPKVRMEERALDWSDPAFLYPIPRL